MSDTGSSQTVAELRAQLEAARESGDLALVRVLEERLREVADAAQPAAKKRATRSSGT